MGKWLDKIIEFITDWIVMDKKGRERLLDKKVDIILWLILLFIFLSDPTRQTPRPGRSGYSPLGEYHPIHTKMWIATLILYAIVIIYVRWKRYRNKL